MILTSLITISLISLASDIYLWYRVVRHWSAPWRQMHWLPLCIMGLFIVLMLTRISFPWSFTLLTYLFLLASLPRFFHALFALLRMPRLGVAVRIVLVAIVLFGMTYGWRNLVVRDIPVCSSRVPAAFHGYRIAQISDLHIGTYAHSPKMVEEIVEKVNGAKPDLIVFTGDIVNTSPEELRPFLETLSCLDAPDGVLSIMGNHDYCTYGPKRNAEEHRALEQEILDMQKQMGWQVLQNEHILLYHGTDSIALIGVEYDGHSPFPRRADLGKAMHGLPETIYKVLLSHDPSHWRRAVLGRTNIDLTLSGHTHAMHLRMGNWSPSALLFSEWGGLYHQERQFLHVNTGTGSNIPFRLGAWPEISVVTLSCPDASSADAR